MANSARDQNRITTISAVSSSDSTVIVPLKANPATGRLLTEPSGSAVTGPGSSTDNAVVRFDGTGGATLQNSAVIIDDSGNVSGVGTIGATGVASVSGVVTPSTGTGLTIYNTSDQATNYERLTAKSSANVFQIFSESAGTGTLRNVRIGDSDEYLAIQGSSSSYKFAFLRVAATTASLLNIGATGGLSASSGSQTALGITPNIAQSGTAGYSALLINPTESSTGSGSKRLISGQVGSVDKFVVDNAGNITGGTINGNTITTGTGTLTLAASSTLATSGANAITLTSTGATNVTLPTTGTLSTLAGSETLTNKTLTAPKIANAGFIADANGNEQMVFNTTASAVTYVDVTNGATGTGPTVKAAGETNTDLYLDASGTGIIRLLQALLKQVVALSDGANIATDASLGNIFTVTLGGSRTMDNPTNAVNGQMIMYRLKQDATGSRTITWGSNFRGSTDVALPTLTTTANAVDYVLFIYNSSATKWDCLAVNKGFAS